MNRLLLLSILACDGAETPPDVGAADARTDASASVDASALDAGASLRRGQYLVGATIITGLDEAPLEGMAVWIQDGRIRAIEPRGDEAGLDVLLLDGLFLLPGLIDAHTHVATGPINLALDQSLDFGVTTLRDVASPMDEIIPLRDSIALGRDGPRIVTAGASFTHPDGHPIGTLFVGNDYLIEQATRGVDDLTEARMQVRALATAGVDFVKCVLTGCHPAGSCPRLDVAVLEAIIDESHMLGLTVAVHTDSSTDATDALMAGADTLEHGVTDGVMSQSLAADIAAAGVYYVPTIGVVSTYAPASVAELVENVSRVRAAGGRVVVGTDANNFGATWGASMFQEIQRLVDAGYTRREAINAATRLASEMIGLADEIGTVEVGKRADLMVVDGDPLIDLAALVEVKLVMRDGKILRDSR